jgi:hypothetical protein
MSILKPQKDGKTGIKRTIGFILIIVSVCLAIVDQFTDYKVNIAIWTTMFGAGATLVGITALPNIK